MFDYQFNNFGDISQANPENVFEQFARTENVRITWESQQITQTSLPFQFRDVPSVEEYFSQSWTNHIPISDGWDELGFHSICVSYPVGEASLDADWNSTAVKELSDVVKDNEINCDSIPEYAISSKRKKKDPPKKVGRKFVDTGLSKRKDVILKKVLRSIRIFFWKAFKAATRYCVRKKKNKCEQFLYDECVRDFVRTNLQLQTDAASIQTLGDFLWMHPSRKSADNEFYDALYRFSVKKFKKIAKNSFFCTLLHKYEELVDWSSLSEYEQIGFQILLKEL